MTHHFVDDRKQPDGALEMLHSQGCSPVATDQHDLGDFGHFLESAMEARESDWDTSGCGRSSPDPEG